MHASAEGSSVLRRAQREADAAAEGRDMAGGELRTNILGEEDGGEGGEGAATAAPFSVLPEGDEEGEGHLITTWFWN
jgi:hypothetical protein